MASNIPFWLIALWLVMVISTHVGLAMLFRKAGEDAWKAFVPGLNYYIWAKLTGRGLGWFIAMLIPLINVVPFLVLAVDLAKVFGRNGFLDGIGAMVFSFAYFPWLGMRDDAIYVPPGEAKEEPKGFAREWADAIAFAVVAATFIRIFFFEAYTIPTTSMEGSLLAGDFLFVSKFHYGARIPNTPLAFPFAHQKMPVTGGKAYLENPQLPYMRLPGLQNIKRNDIVVFNWPEGDTIYAPIGSQESFYQLQRSLGSRFYMDRNLVARINPGFAQPGGYGTGSLETFPVDKRENYIKRCVGVPGDEIEIREGLLYVNGETGMVPSHQQFRYQLSLKPNQVLLKKDLNRIGLNYTMASFSDFKRLDGGGNGAPLEHLSVDGEAGFIGTYSIHADAKQVEALRALPAVAAVNPVPADRFTNGRMFPNVITRDSRAPSVDDFGPIKVPKRGETVQLTPENLPIYSRIIKAFEDSEFRGSNFRILQQRVLSGEQVDYTFQLNYYFMMGDNRHNSQDSRFWGFVPEDHVVGKAWFVWWSWDVNKSITSRITSIRLSRLLKPIKHQENGN